MFLILIVLSLYVLLLFSEQALVGIAPAEIEHHRNSEDHNWQPVIKLYDRLKPALSALLTARILMALLAGTILAFHLLRNRYLLEFLQTISPARQAVWAVVAVLAVLSLALTLWALARATLHATKGINNPRTLIRLAPFVSFWMTLSRWMTLGKTKVESNTGNNDDDTGRIPASREKRELELLRSIVQFGDVTVKQVMQTRSRVVSVDFRTPYPELLVIVRETGFSRLPVIDEELDNVTGILYVKDLIPHLDAPDSFEWQALVRTSVMVVPESKRGSELLEEFKREKMHLAIVVDEYGGTSGIVTLEDILEEVTGDIRDEFDEESEIRYRKLDDRNYLFDGQTLLNDVCRITGINPVAFENLRGNSDTVAGLVLEIRGDIPVAGEEVACRACTLTVTAANNRRIEQVRLTIL